MLNSGSKLAAHACAAMLLGVTGLMADGTGPFSASAPVPVVDMWMYSNAGNPGGAARASTFTALPLVGAGDDRLSQFLIKFDTVAAGIPAGLGASNYDPSKIVLTALLVQGGVPYDPTEDSRLTHGTTAPLDPDPGRAIEVHGAGFRNSFTAATYKETSFYGGGSPYTRNAYAMGYSPEGLARDVTNNVTQGFDSIPWGVARILASALDDNSPPYTELTPGANIPIYAHAVFELNLKLPGVAEYVRTSLNQGFIWLTVSSLHSATQQGSAGYPAFFTKENSEQADYGDVAASLKVEYSLPLRVQSFSRNNSTQIANIVWNASPGYKYVVESSATLANGSWAPVGTFTTLTPASLNWSGSSTPGRAFFRVARSKQP